MLSLGISLDGSIINFLSKCLTFSIPFNIATLYKELLDYMDLTPSSRPHILLTESSDVLPLFEDSQLL